MFVDDYASARRRFRQAAAARGARLRHVVHPLGTPDGDELAIDLAWLGPADAPNVLLVTSGMHGFEGPAGSAVQSVWLEGTRRVLPENLAVALVHALNPWGFAWVSRLTENNVDLNRNFIDWSLAIPQNPYYAHIRNIVRVADMSLQTLVTLETEQRRLARELGPAAAQVASDFGQYEDPEGITFGGLGAEFGHRTLRDRVVPLLAYARHVGVIDWHTGVGAYGEVAVLPIDGPGSANAKRVAGWWGETLVEGWKRSPLEDEIAHDPNLNRLPILKTGQMIQALTRWLPRTQISGAVIEFGTEREGALSDLIYITLYERWLRFVDRGNRMAAAHRRFRDTARKCFVPEDADWRELVVREGPKLIDKAIEGLAD